MKKVLSFLLSVIFIINIFVTLPLKTSAAARDWAGGDCVKYIRARFQEYYGSELHWPGDNARGYYYNAGNYGDTTSGTPAVGCLAVWDYGNTGWSHVAFVEAVSGNTVHISEGGYDGHYNERDFNVGNMNISWNDANGYHYQNFLGFVYVNGTNPSVKATNAWMNVSASAIPVGWSVTFTFGANNATDFYIGINKDGSRIITEAVSSGVSYTFDEKGNYTAYVTATNFAGGVDSNVVKFTVFNPLNLGDKFTAGIINASTGTAVTVASNQNAEVQKYIGANNQLWLFERQEDRSYKITNVSTGLCLDVVDGASSNNTNIWTYISNNSMAQRWYFRANGSGYSLVPKCATHGCLDMIRETPVEGSNIAMWTCADGNTNQIFTLKYELSPDYIDTFNKNQYELYNTTLPWKEAYKFCEQQGGHLVTINSQSEQDFISDFIAYSANNRIWVGGTDSYSEGNWKWITGDNLTYTNWDFGEPNNSLNNENFMMLFKNSNKWNDVDDILNETGYTYSFICEYENYVNPSQVSLEKAFDYSGHYYEIYSGSVDWQTAKKFCEQKGGHLVTITTAEENNAISSNIRGLKHDCYWLGLTDVALESQWKWITGESYFYKNWGLEEPNNSGGAEDYAVYVSANGQWNDLMGRSCLNTNIGFVCEYDSISILGDTDGDSEITPLDATYAQRYNAMMKTGIDEAILMQGDVDNNGELDIIDATYIQRYLAKMQIPYAIGEKIN